MAARTVAEQGFPDRRNENWRYTNVEPIFEHQFEPAVEPVRALVPGDLDELLLDDSEAQRLVLVNGFFEPRLSSLAHFPPGLSVANLAQVLERQPQRLQEALSPDGDTAIAGFAALNDAYHSDGAYIHVAANARIEQPIEILYVAIEIDRPISVHPRSVVVLEPGARLTLTERFLSTGNSCYLTNVRTQVKLGQGALLQHFRVQQESRQAFHIGAVGVQVDAGGRYENHNFALGARIGRTEIGLDYAGEQASCAVNGLFLAGDGQLQDFHSNVEHAWPSCRTEQNFKGILSGQGRGVFDGRFHVHRDAQHTDAAMRNDNLLLSRNAEVDTKPQLEIYADDVKCSHGATVGQLDDAALFYLRSRGIPLARARQLLTWGFAADLLNRIETPALRDWVEGSLRRQLEQHHV
jgi:Fe-S cluster assembly protein SufD